MKHFGAMILVAAAVAVVFGAIGRETPRERLVYGLKVFGEFIGVGLGLAWLLYFLPQ